ncbi:uncharacterized protein TNCV_87051 [Trichonephila clavipes]|nr:uncharacterized protein TNCV_87051 [Trichonephila clavipes]
MPLNSLVGAAAYVKVRKTKIEVLKSHHFTKMRVALSAESIYFASTEPWSFSSSSIEFIQGFKKSHRPGKKKRSAKFLFNIRNPTNKKTGPLTSDEMKEAEIYLMKQVQLSSFYKEIRAMQNGDDICNKSANREIKALSKLVRDREESLFAFFAEGIEWSFIPPRSPNWGGLWEANIKSLIYHFKRVAGNSKFSYEELLTLITQIEAILNSRPLTPLSSDVDDLEVLTPAHFLIGRPITAIVEPSLLQCESNRLNVWQRITKSSSNDLEKMEPFIFK